MRVSIFELERRVLVDLVDHSASCAAEITARLAARTEARLEEVLARLRELVACGFVVQLPELASTSSCVYLPTEAAHRLAERERGELDPRNGNVVHPLPRDLAIARLRGVLLAELSRTIALPGLAALKLVPWIDDGPAESIAFDPSALANERSWRAEEDKATVRAWKIARRALDLSPPGCRWRLEVAMTALEAALLVSWSIEPVEVSP